VLSSFQQARAVEHPVFPHENHRKTSERSSLEVDAGIHPRHGRRSRIFVLQGAGQSDEGRRGLCLVSGDSTMNSMAEDSSITDF
jgi:hypothetical protein